MTVILYRALIGSFEQLSWPTILLTALAMEAAFLAFKYKRFTILTDALFGAAAVVVTGIATFTTLNLAPGDAAIQFRAEVIQLIVTVVPLLPVSYVLPWQCAWRSIKLLSKRLTGRCALVVNERLFIDTFPVNTSSAARKVP